MNKYMTIVYFVLLAQVHAWLPLNPVRKIAVTRLAAAELPMDGNPCWEDLYDDDCVMSNAASASFVAADWIKSMPCGEGIQVR